MFNIQPFVFVPERFDHRFGHEINDTVELKDPVGNIFVVRYIHGPGDARLSDGILELRSLHKIESTLHIQFVYCGQARFTINIYKLWPSEIDYKIGYQMISSTVDAESSTPNKNYNYLEQYRGSDLMWSADITIKHIYGEQPMVGRMFL